MLINSIAELKAQIGGVQKVMAWPTWEPAVRQAEMKYVVPSIGQDLYSALVAVTQPTPVQAELLARLKAAVAFFAYVENIPFLLVATGDAGLSVITPSNTGTVTKWMYVAIVKDVVAKSDFWLEDSLQWLEAHATSFPAWKESEFYTITNGQFIPSASSWTKAFPSAKNSRRLFLSVRQYLFNAEDDFIRPLLGNAYFEVLKEKLGNKDSVLTIKEANVIRLCRKAIANHGFIKALPFLNLNEDFRIVSETDGVVNEDELDGGRLNIVLNACREAEASATTELIKYLNENASTLVFPEYFASDRYRPPVANQTRVFNNDPANKFFALL